MSTKDSEWKELRDLVYRLKYPPTKGAYQVKVDDVMKAITTAINEAVVEARIDQLNQIRHSDVKLNHGTIELMGYMSQELNKEKLEESKNE